MISIGYGYKPVLDMKDDPAAMRLIEACRPGIGVGSETEFRTLWAEMERHKAGKREKAAIRP